MPKILIADDNNNIQKMVSLAFEERGIQVVSVGNGEAAVRRLADLNPDIVLADIFMPVRSGYEVCEYIKKDQRFSHIPVILLVGAFDPLDEKEARRVGADGVLKKPFVPPDPLIAMVTSVLEKNPRIAAELAKAKEVVAQPPFLPEPEIAAKIELKPLPEFPEPTAEEAAMLYGFGNGRRSTFGDEQDREGAEPVVAEEPEEFNSEDVVPDWRRAAMEFEVPQEVGGRPAFSDQTSFPSERDYPPRRVLVPEFEEKLESVVAEPETFFVPAIEEAEAVSETVGAGLAAPHLDMAEKSATEGAPERETSISDEPQISAERSVTEAGSASQLPHWMDGLSAEPSTVGWMAALENRQEVKEPEQAPASLTLCETPAPLNTPQIEAQGFESERDSLSAGESTNESWFAPAPIPSDAVAEAEPDHTSEAALNLTEALVSQRADVDASRKDPNLIEPTALRVAPEPLLDTEETDISASFSRRDPYLVEPPAVHVAPEPLLDAEEPQPSCQVNSGAEEITAAHTLFVPDPEPAVSSFEHVGEEFNERIPTGPPPSREALTDIPFLTPPANFHPDATEEAEISDETVDALVQRVLEKLEPQLYEMLSQGVLRPLVENLLQGELAKKNR